MKGGHFRGGPDPVPTRIQFEPDSCRINALEFDAVALKTINPAEISSTSRAKTEIRTGRQFWIAARALCYPFCRSTVNVCNISARRKRALSISTHSLPLRYGLAAFTYAGLNPALNLAGNESDASRSDRDGFWESSGLYPRVYGTPTESNAALYFTKTNQGLHRRTPKRIRHVCALSINRWTINRGVFLSKRNATLA